MKKNLTTHQAKTHLSRIIEEVLAGVEVVICRGQEPVVKIVKYQAGKNKTARPKIGTKTSLPVTYAADAFVPLLGNDLKIWGME